MPQLSGLLETSLYVEDLERSSRFYRTLFGFESLFADTRLHALSVTGGHDLPPVIVPTRMLVQR